MAVWHWFFPVHGPSPAALESIARVHAVTELFEADARRYREQADEIGKLERRL